MADVHYFTVTRYGSIRARAQLLADRLGTLAHKPARMSWQRSTAAYTGTQAGAAGPVRWNDGYGK